ncbi:hypothetical protein [Paracidovorax sp. MALMAid1276]|uniref:hypothetical protein n=1 Tax=Paracidovorax sp. MALMAid1276 TaxID=3411631 RepID=UPI003B991B57
MPEHTHSRFVALHPSTPTRRQFSGYLAGSGLLALAGCGGGGGGNAAVDLPRITEQPQPQAVAAGASATFRVQAVGVDLQYTWRRNSVDIPGASASVLQWTASAADDGARFSVVVGNAAGRVESQPALLAVSIGATAGLSVVAGAIGGAGYLDATGAAARLTNPLAIARGLAGDVYVGCGYSLAKASADGSVRFLGELPYGAMACNSKGELFTCIPFDHGVHRLVEAGTPTWVRVAGDPAGNPGWVDGGAAESRLSFPTSPVFDEQDNLYLLDSGNRAIRKISATGQISTLAGHPGNTVSLDGQGTAAGFALPLALVRLRDGTLLVADGSRWRKVTPSGAVSTLAGSVPAGIVTRSLRAGPDDRLFAVEGGGTQGTRVVQVELQGTVKPIAGTLEAGYVEGAGADARFGANALIDVLGDDLLALADMDNHVVRKVQVSSGQTSSWIGAASNAAQRNGVGEQARLTDVSAGCRDAVGNVYLLQRTRRELRRVEPGGSVTTHFENFPSDGAVVMDAAGYFYGVRNRAIYRVSPSGVEQLWAGQPGLLGYADGVGADAQFASPRGLALDSQGNLWVGDEPAPLMGNPLAPTVGYQFGGTIRKIAPDRRVTTVCGVPGKQYDFAEARPLIEARRTGVPAVDLFISPRSLGVDASGRVWIVDDGDVLCYSATGTFQFRLALQPAGAAPAAGPARMLALSPSGEVYVVCAGIDLRSGWTLWRAVLSGAGWASTRVAGSSEPYRLGIQAGALPGTLGTVQALVWTGPATVHISSENALLRLSHPV